jgi:GNAT superfamily N-acetyltransferase
MPVRDATPDDVDEIHALIRELAAYERLEDQAVATVDDLRRHLFGDDPAARVLMADSGDGSVVGFALWFRTFSTFLGRPGIWLEDLFVRPTFRGQGHGRALLDALAARPEGRVEWSVLDWNEPSIAFYRSLGAVPMDEWTTYRWQPSATADDEI